jgi:hypothetical protein
MHWSPPLYKKTSSPVNWWFSVEWKFAISDFAVKTEFFEAKYDEFCSKLAFRSEFDIELQGSLAALGSPVRKLIGVLAGGFWGLLREEKNW